MTTPGYRPDIDGLRALAVLPVVLFHAGVTAMAGGYVGVDIFFVISGYLITAIIASEVAAGRFSLIGFYERRARRILPALFAVMAVCAAVAWGVMTPGALSDFADSVLATAVFGSNVYFWQAQGYFETAAEYRVLLHTWSLAVEEQFYLLWPLLLIAAARLPRRLWHGAVIGALVLSLIGSMVLVAKRPEAAFYLAPSRAWELLAGAVIALGLVPAWRSPRWREAAAVVGLILVFAPMVLYDAATPFPGLAAVPPCLGAALLIHAGPGTHVARGLSARPLVFVGLISYGLYLWHWPVLAFLRIGYGSVDLSPAVTAAAVAASFVLAIISWRFVERPFRQRGTVTRRHVFAVSAAGLGTAIAAGIVVVATAGMPFRLPAAMKITAAAATDISAPRRPCLDRMPDQGLCTMGKAGAEPGVLVWGDSHANAVLLAMDVALSASGRGGALAAHGSCPPLLGVHPDLGNGASCQRFNEAVLERVESGALRVDTVVLAARWALYASGERAEGEAGPPLRLMAAGATASALGDDTQTNRITYANADGVGSPVAVSGGAAAGRGGMVGNRLLFRRGLDALVGRLRDAGVDVVLLGGVPEIGWNVPATMVARQRLALPAPDVPDLAAVQARNRGADAILADVGQRHGATLLPLAPLLCRPDCRVMDGHRALYADDNHLSYYGSRDVLGAMLVGRLWHPQAARLH